MGRATTSRENRCLPSSATIWTGRDRTPRSAAEVGLAYDVSLLASLVGLSIYWLLLRD